MILETLTNQETNHVFCFVHSIIKLNGAFESKLVNAILNIIVIYSLRLRDFQMEMYERKNFRVLRSSKNVKE